MIHRKPTRNFFTLLELLIVVAILAIIGGGMIASYDGLEESAGHKAMTRDMAALNQAVRTFKVLNQTMPNNVESLLRNNVASIGSLTGDDNVTTSLGSTTAVASFLPAELKALITPRDLTQAQLDNLIASGITQVRYLDVLGDDETVSNLSIASIEGGNATGVGTISTIDIPGHAFETPSADAASNRGRGFVLDFTGVTVSNTSPVFAIWGNQTTGGAGNSAPTSIYENTKVGAKATDVLVAFGIGHSATMVKGDFQGKISYPPFHTGLGKAEYNHYIMLVNVSVTPAKLVTIINAAGNTIDDEFSESKEQK
ncbi:MAG: prepilin-type N-terminal cleavage/methylation domain-containing protein [Lentisphaeraceae bacterium]|nr:prepilin-type N-terminal cleavage/methylation domain-containing protein [Lentisphaeraceae bacterium]